ncbi:MAG: glutamyl-tRNA reductase, partial [Vicinamibacteria bacterium]|nr:glutamyl-tRNA reductase [Vicinamibacteria bacterium]
PEVRRIENVFLYDLDDLKAVSEANLRERQREAQGAESIVESEARAFLDWQKARDGVPLIAALRDRADEIRKGELQKARRRMGNLSAEQDAALEAAMTALINKLIHPSLVHIKDMAREGRGEEDMALIRRLLGL